MGDQRKAPATLPRETWMGPAAGLDGCGKSHHHRKFDNSKHLQLHSKPKRFVFSDGDQFVKCETKPTFTIMFRRDALFGAGYVDDVCVCVCVCVRVPV